MPGPQLSTQESDKKFSKNIIGRTVVSKTGKRFGEVGDIVFEASTGELIHVFLRNVTPFAERLELERNKEGQALIPFTAVMALGDFVVVAEEDLVSGKWIRPAPNSESSRRLSKTSFATPSRPSLCFFRSTAIRRSTSA